MCATLAVLADCYLASFGGMSRVAPSLDRSSDVRQGCRTFTTTHEASGTGIFVSTFDEKRMCSRREDSFRARARCGKSKLILVVISHL